MGIEGTRSRITHNQDYVMKKLLIKLFGKTTFKAVNGCEITLRNECFYNESLGCVLQEYSDTKISGEDDGTVSVVVGEYTYCF
jgi:hypothetical protein